MNTTADQKDQTTSNTPSFGDIPLACIRASKTNPRKIFNETDLNDLAKSIKTQGVAQPILVRPIEVIDGVTYFEIVAGERRFRASKLAEMPTVPAIVRELSNQAAYEIQVLENLQRVDLHPLEEAEGFEVMMSEYKVSADELAEKVGKSKAYIYASLKLCALESYPRKLFYDGLLTKSTALLVARIPVRAHQEKCAKEITSTHHGVMSTRAAAEHIERAYMLHLKKADFKPSDPDLFKEAGSCTACPKRTGNQPHVFSDVNADVCTDSMCYHQKASLQVIRIKQLATANGQTVISGAAAKKIMPYSNSGSMEGGYVDIDAPNYKDPKHRSYRQILGKDMPVTTMLDNPHKAAIVEVVRLAEIAPLMKAKGAAAPQADNDAEKARQREKEQEAKAKLEREYRLRLFTDIHHSTLMLNLVDLDLRLIALQLYDDLPGNTIPKKQVMSLIGWTEEMFGWPDRRAKVRAAIDALTPAALNQFIRACALCRDLDVNVYTATKDDVPANLLAFAVRAKVDAKKIRSEIDAAAKEKADEKKKSAAKKAAKAKPAATATAKTAKPAQKTAKKPAAKPSLPAKTAKAKKESTPKAPVPVQQELPETVVAGPKAFDPNAAWPFPTSSRAALEKAGATTTTKTEGAKA